MLELGEREAAIHHELGRTVAAGADYLLTMGTLGADLAAGALAGGMRPDHVLLANTHEELGMRLRALLRAGDVMSLKGSRGARMERVLEEL